MLDETRELINKIGEQFNIRLTVQRKLILKILIEQQQQHLLVDEIYTLVKEEGASIGLATIYRTLDLLEEKGVVAKRDFGDGSARYELLFRNTDLHHHLVCKKCGKVIETTGLLVDDFKEQIVRDNNFKPVDYWVQVEGYCGDCQED
ncbi:Fur family transcriptional regulator [Halanaerobaculum tunisiense]